MLCSGLPCIRNKILVFHFNLMITIYINLYNYIFHLLKKWRKIPKLILHRMVNDSVNNELPHNNSINLGTGFLRIGSHNAVISTSDARWNVAYRVVCQFSFATSEMISFARYPTSRKENSLKTQKISNFINKIIELQIYQDFQREWNVEKVGSARSQDYVRMI